MIEFANGQSDSAECERAAAKIADYESTLKDWANLNRYSEANKKELLKTGDTKRVVFIGDSITEGWALDRYFPGKAYIKRGIGGQTTPQMLLRFRSDVINLRPKAVVILAGTNDIAGNTGPMTFEDITGNLTSMAELAKAANIRVILSSVLPVNDRVKKTDGSVYVQTSKRPHERIKALNDWLRTYAASNKLIYLDYYLATADENGTLKDGLSYDGLHPNANGYKVMQALAERAISEALKK
ncbi:MAG: SGNH/GDSL hydrolase family protein [Saprospiraceae bacterium]|nr:SGNH/GDSL hydrolase family protein [Pyrinomonadaceae bacterium]